jgi:hypothetical protein
MKSAAVAEFFSGRVHYAWVVLVVMFCAMLAGGGVRVAPGVMILPLERAFGWSLGTISSAVSINIILLGYRAAPDRSGPGDRSEAYDPGVYGAIGSRHGPVAL